MWTQTITALWLLSSTSYSQPSPIKCSDVVTGSIDSGTPIIEYTFQLNINYTSVTFSTCHSETNYDTQINLRDEQVRKNFDDDDNSCASNYLASTLTVTLSDINYENTYYVDVTNSDRATDSYGDFKLTVTCDDTYTTTTSTTSTPQTTIFQTTVDTSNFTVFCNETVTGSINAYGEVEYEFTLPSQYASVIFSTCIAENVVDTVLTLVIGPGSYSRACLTYSVCSDDDAIVSRCARNGQGYYDSILEIPPGEISVDTLYYLKIKSFDTGIYAMNVECIEPPPTIIQSISCNAGKNRLNGTISDPPSAYYYYQFELPNQYEKALFTTCFPETTEDLRISIYDEYGDELFNSMGSAIYCPFGGSGYAPALILNKNDIAPNTNYYISLEYKLSGNSNPDYYGLGVTCFDGTSNIPNPTNPNITSELECGAITPKTSSDSGENIFYYTFTFPDGYTSARISTCNFEGPHNLDHDTQIVIYDDAFQKIAENDDSNCSYFDFAATVTLNKGSGTTYYLSVSYFGYPEFTDSFDFILSASCYGTSDPIEPVPVETISCGQTDITGEITNSKSLYYYELMLDSHYERLIFSTCNENTALLSEIAIYDGDWDLLVSNSDAENGCSWNSDASTIIYAHSFLDNGTFFYVSVTPESDGLLGGFALNVYCVGAPISNKLDLTGVEVTNLTCGTNSVPSMSQEIFYYAFQPPADFDQLLFSTCNGLTDIIDTKITVYDSNLTIRDADLYFDDYGCAQSYILTDDSIYYLTASYTAYPFITVAGNIGISTTCWDYEGTVPDVFPPVDYCTRIDNETNTCYIDVEDDSVIISGIICDPQYANCVVTCGPGNYACYHSSTDQGLFVDCPSNGCEACIVDCTGRASCAKLKITGNDCGLLEVNILGDDQNYMTVVAPGNGGTLVINGSDAGYYDFENAIVTSVFGTSNMILDLRLSYARWNIINGEFVTDNLLYTCGTDTGFTHCIGTEITCPNDATCIVDCIGYCSDDYNPFVVRAVEGTHDVDWFCNDADTTACEGAKLVCIGNNTGNWSIETTWMYDTGSWSYNTLSGGGCTDLPTVNPTPAPSNAPTQFTLSPTLGPSDGPTGAPTLPSEAPTNNPTEEYGFCDDDHRENKYIDFTVADVICEACLCGDDSGWAWTCLILNNMVWDDLPPETKGLFLMVCPLKNKDDEECENVGLVASDGKIDKCLCSAFKCTDGEAGEANIIGVWKVIGFVIAIILCI